MLVIEYEYDWDEFGPSMRILPHKKARLTGRYREVNHKLYIQIEEKHFFGLHTTLKWVSESSFTFTEINEFECGGNNEST